MDLFAAAELFAGGTSDADRLGEARTYLELADTFRALDEFLVEVEVAYARAAASTSSLAKGRAALAGLRRDRQRGAVAFQGPAPEGCAAVWAAGRAAAASGQGRAAVEAVLGAARKTAKAADRALLDAASALWGAEGSAWQAGDLGSAAAMLRQGRAAEAKSRLQTIDYVGLGKGPGVDLLLYPLLERAAAERAAELSRRAKGPDAAFLAARATEHLGDPAQAAALYAQAKTQAGTGKDSVWIFSPIYGPREGSRLTSVLRGACLYRLGRTAEAAAEWKSVGSPEAAGALVTAELAERQLECAALGPLADPKGAASAAVATAVSALAGVPTESGGDLLTAVYPVRSAAVCRAAARANRACGDLRRALELMEQAHRKASGYRPSFVNPPAFMVDLSRAYADAGEYPPAVAVLFELTREYMPARLAYESLKRLYATRSGGRAPPR